MRAVATPPSTTSASTIMWAASNARSDSRRFAMTAGRRPRTTRVRTAPSRT